jgi:hypothetical protein
MTSDGGAIATFGFRRQFLATAEEILRVILENGDNVTDLAVVIEPTRAELEGTDVADDDIVDFAIEKAGEIFRRVQADPASRAGTGRVSEESDLGFRLADQRSSQGVHRRRPTVYGPERDRHSHRLIHHPSQDRTITARVDHRSDGAERRAGTFDGLMLAHNPGDKRP